MSELSLESLDIRMARIERIMNGPKRRRVRIRLDGDEDRIDIVQKVVCQVWEITIEQLLSTSRKGSVADARKAAMLLVYDYGLGSTTEVAQRFNREDHSTVSRAMQSAGNHLENKDCAFSGRYNEAKDILDLRFKQKPEIDFQI